MARSMFRHRVVVSDRPQVLWIGGDPLYVEAARLGVGDTAPHVVDFWAEYDDDRPKVGRMFRVFGTGHPLPEGARWRGTTARTADGMVWHLYELLQEQDGSR